MAFSLSVGGNNPVSLNGMKDLAGAATETNLKLGAEFSKFLLQPLSALPAQFSSTAVQYTGASPSWTPGLGGTSPLTFTLSGGVCGKVSVITSGNLLTYTDRFPQTVSTSLSEALDDSGGNSGSPSTQAVSVEAGQAFVAVELDFQISGGLTGSYQQGVYGVTTTDSASATMSVAFYKGCAQTMTLQEAMKAAFQGFVLPMHEKTLEHLSPGDYLHYNFNANLQLGVGATIGYDKVFYAGTTTRDIPKTADAVTLTGTIAPEVQAGAKFCFSYEYCGTFEILVWREADEQAHLHLYRSRVQNTSAGANIGITLSAGAALSMAVATDKMTTLLTQSMPDAIQPRMTSDVLPGAMDQVSKYVGELNDKLTGWLGHTSHQPVGLDLAIQGTRSTFLLTDYTIDLRNAKYGDAWKLMLEGRFLDAMETPGSGVTLATGSGMEALFSRVSAVKLNLFGALHASWTTTTLNNSSLVYAGNNVFHLLTLEGKDMLDVMNKTSREMSFYFAAEADLSKAGSRVPPPQLHCILRATNNAGFGKAIAQLVRRLSSGQGIKALAGTVAATAARPDGVETLHLIFSADAYASLDAAGIAHGRPDDEQKDAQNYEAFRSACAALYTTDPQTLSWRGKPLTYSLWRNAWIASNDEWPAPAGAVPDRRESAGFNPGVEAQLDQALGLGAGASGDAQLVFYALGAATQFMNLCDDPRTLASEEVAYTPKTWGSFVAELAHIVNKDLNKDFMAAAMLALTIRCGGVPTEVSGPMVGLPAGSSIGVTVTYGAGSADGTSPASSDGNQ